MCLTIDHERTYTLSKKYSKSTKLIVGWKRLALNNKSPHYYRKYHCGWNEVRGKVDQNKFSIDGGALHIWQSRDIARRHNYYAKTVKVYYYWKDVLGVGIKGDIAVKRLFIKSLKAHR